MVSTGSIYYYVEDMLRSSRVLTTSAGAVCYDADFYPYGGENVFTNTCSQNHKFTGKERDAETGNDNFGARHYSSTIGRFLTPDPIVATQFHLVNPQRWNSYAYVGNNPLRRLDSSGQLWDPDDHERIMIQAYRQANLPVNMDVVRADRNRDNGGHRSWLAHPVDTLREQYSVGSQRNHFLRDKRETQQEAYNHAISQLKTDSEQARDALRAGDKRTADTATANAEHLIQDSFAHTTRDANGAITHIQCFNCGGAEQDHKHPSETVDLNPSPEYQGAVDASAAFLQLIENSPNMTDEQFDHALDQFIENYEAEGTR